MRCEIDTVLDTTARSGSSLIYTKHSLLYGLETVANNYLKITHVRLILELRLRISVCLFRESSINTLTLKPTTKDAQVARYTRYGVRADLKAPIPRLRTVPGKKSLNVSLCTLDMFFWEADVRKLYPCEMYSKDSDKNRPQDCLTFLW